MPTTSARHALAALSLVTLLSALGTSIANVGLPVLAQHFGAGFGAIQWVVLAYLLASTAMVAVAGRLGDRHGRRRLLLGGIALFTIASIGCALAPSLGLLVAARAAQGIGAAAMMALAMPFVGAVVPSKRSGSAMGLLGTMSAAGTALGPSVGGAMIAACGWPGLFFTGVPLGVLAFAMAWAFLPPDGAPGQGTAGAGASGLLYAALGANALVTAVVMTTLVVGPFYLSGALALDSARTGLVMSCGPLAAALGGVPAGRAVDRYDAGRIALSGLACMLAACVLLALLPSSTGIPGYAVPLVLCTTGYALFQAANNTTVMAAVAPGRRGAASGLLNLSRNAGLIAGASVMGALFAAAAGMNGAGSTAPEAVAAGMHITFGACAVLVLAAMAIATRARPAPARV